MEQATIPYPLWRTRSRQLVRLGGSSIPKRITI